MLSLEQKTITFTAFMQRVTGRTDITELKNGTECTLVGELAYFLGKQGYKLALDIPYCTEILKDYINRMIDMGVELGVSANTNITYNKSLFFSKENRQPFDYYVIDKKVDNSWSMDVRGNNLENIYLDSSDGAGYVPLYAYYLVDSFVRGEQAVSLTFTSSIHDNIVYRNVGVLVYCDNKLGGDIIHFENLERGQLEWLCYLFSRVQRGMTEWSIEQKYKWVSTNVEIGDIVLLYNTDGARDFRRAKLVSCWIAKVLDITESGVLLEYYVSAEMVLTQVERVDRRFSGSIIRPTYEDYKRFDSIKRWFSFDELGIDSVKFEKYFITLPMIDDGSAQVFILPKDNGHGYEIRTITLDTFDTIYSVLENRGIKYNRDKFVDMYFTSRNVVPFYDRFRNHQPTRYESNLNKSQLLEKYGTAME